MKTIIDNETGELIEVEETNELVVKELEDMGIITTDYLDKLEQFAYLKQQIEMIEYKNKELIKEVFKKHNVKSCKSDYINISYIPEHMQQRVDVEKLKQDGLYDKYTKFGVVKESIRIKLKEGKD